MKCARPLSQIQLLTTLAGAATDLQVFVGRASGKTEITDFLAGEH